MLLTEKKTFHQISSRFSVLISLLLLLALSGCGGLGDDEEDEDDNNANQQGNSTDLVGAWEFTSSDFATNINTYLVLTNTGEFFFFNHAPDPEETCRELGFEYGTYTISGNRVTVNGTYNSNRCVGLLDTDETSSSFTFNQESQHLLTNLKFSDDEDEGLNIEARRINVGANDLIGAWHEPLDRKDDLPESNDKSLILLVLPNGVYYSMDADVVSRSESSFAFGTYTYNTSTGEFALTDEYHSRKISNETIVININSVGDQLKGDGLLLDRIFLGGIDPEVNNGGGIPAGTANHDCREPEISFQLGTTIDETFDSLERYSCFWYSIGVNQGTTYELAIEDQWTGLPNGSDTMVEFYEEGSFPISSDPVIVDNNENKVDSPIMYQAKSNDTLFIKFLNDGGINPSELADIKFRLDEQ